MDPVGGTSAIISFIDVGIKIGKYLKDVYKAPEERRILYEEAQRLEISVQRWQKLVDEAKAHPNDPGHQFFADLVTQKGVTAVQEDDKKWQAVSKRELFFSLHKLFRSRSSEQRVIPVEISRPKSKRQNDVLWQFLVLQKQLEEKVAEKKGFQGVRDRLTWSITKVSAADLQKKLRNFREHLDELLAQGDHDLLRRV